MKIIVGLGNPGLKYETTRHNAGFLALDRLVDRWKATGPVSKFHGLLYQASFGSEKVCLLKPQTFMNLSGKSVSACMSFYQSAPEDLVVIHDDLALNPMALRLKCGGGTGGHNGLKSIDESLGKDRSNYFRIRVGIGHPATLQEPSRISPADYVLQPFLDSEIESLDPLLDQITEAIEEVLRGNIQTAMNKYHRLK